MLCKSGRGLYSSNINFLQAPKCIFFNLFITLAYLTHFYCNVQWAYYLLVIKKIPMYLSIHFNIFKGSIMPFYSRQFNILKPFCLSSSNCGLWLFKWKTDRQTPTTSIWYQAPAVNLCLTIWLINLAYLVLKNEHIFILLVSK